MTIEAYFDGTAVRPLEEVSLEPNQKVFDEVISHKVNFTKTPHSLPTTQDI